jgi:hypothetical protein
MDDWVNSVGTGGGGRVFNWLNNYTFFARSILSLRGTHTLRSRCRLSLEVEDLFGT